MNKRANYMGQIAALNQLGLVPDESLAELGLFNNLASDPDQAMGLSSGQYTLPAVPSEHRQTEDPSWWHFFRHVAPVAGGLVGAGMMGLRPGQGAPINRALKGFLAGAGVGSIPNILDMSAHALPSSR